MKKAKIKSILVIGMGRFGKHLAMKMQALGHSVMVVDMRDQQELTISSIFDDYMIGDCTDEIVLSSLGIGNFDICFVTIGKNFEASIIITSLLKNLGAKYIVTRAGRDIQTEVLRKIGANDIIYPEREYAEKLAIRYNAAHILDFFNLAGGFAIFEIMVPAEWIDKSIVMLNVRQRYHVNILVIKNEVEVQLPKVDYIFKPNDIIVIMGKENDVYGLSSQ